MPRQLAFDLPVRAALGRSDFLVAAPNAVALATLEGGNWPQGKLILVGPEGAGKTHLTHVWAAAETAAVVAASDLADADIPALAARGVVAIEDADRIAGDASAENALFHLHNLTLAEGGRLLVTARRAPGGWGLILPDLASRMQAAGIATIAPPDDVLLSAVLVKLFADRQLSVPPALIPWLVQRMDRSFAGAQRLVAALDARALAEGRPVTRALAQAVLDSDAPDRP